MGRWFHLAAARLAEMRPHWLLDISSRPQRLPEFREASTPAGDSPNIPRLCHCGSEVGRWRFAVMVVMAVMAATTAIVMSRLWAKAIALPLWHSMQQSPLLGKYCSSAWTESSRQFQACYIIISHIQHELFAPGVFTYLVLPRFLPRLDFRG
jgi:hypothetical protein